MAARCERGFCSSGFHGGAVGTCRCDHGLHARHDIASHLTEPEIDRIIAYINSL